MAVSASASAAKLEFKAPSQVLEAGVHAAKVIPTTLVGTWTNVDHATRDLIKIVIAASGSGITVDAFGACSPTPCNWGSVPALSYAANVSSSQAVGFTASYTFSFSKVVVVGHLQGKDLIVETYTDFTDSSGRSNYYFSNTMAK